MTKAKVKERQPNDGLFGTAAAGAEVPPKSATPPATEKQTKTRAATKHTYEDERQRANDTASKKAVAKVERLPPPSPLNMLTIIAEAAANPAVDVGKMRELLTMQREIMAEDARIAYTEAFIGLALPTIERDGRIDEGVTRSGRQGKKTRYATFENLNAVCAKLLREAGFALWFEPDIGADSKIVVRGHLDHVKGHGKTCAIPLGLDTTGAKNAGQAAASSISYGKRLAMIAMLNIQTYAPEDRDRDGETKRAAGQEADAPDPDAKINGSQAQQLLKAINDSGIEATRFMEKYGITAVHDLPLAQLSEAMKALKNYGDAAKAKAARETKA